MVSRLYRSLLAGDSDRKTVVDLSVPNNVDKNILAVSDVHFIEIEALRSAAEKSRSHREREKTKAGAIIDRRIYAYRAHWHERQVERALAHIPDEVRAVKERAVEEVFAKDFAQLDPAAQELVLKMLGYMEKVCRHIPIKAAKAIALHAQKPHGHETGARPAPVSLRPLTPVPRRNRKHFPSGICTSQTPRPDGFYRKTGRAGQHAPHVVFSEHFDACFTAGLPQQPMSFILKMAWRDSRRNRARLFLFISAITVGIAALTAVRSFSVNLTADIDREAKTLLGADLLVDANQEAPDSLLRMLELPGGERADVTNFMSMVRFPANGGTPALADQGAGRQLSLLRQVEKQPGELVEDVPQRKNRAGRPRADAPVRHPPGRQHTGRQRDLRHRRRTAVLSRQGGHRFQHCAGGVHPRRLARQHGPHPARQPRGLQYFYKMPAGTDPEALVKPLEKQMENAGLGWDTVEERKRNIGKAFGNFGTFLNLVGFIALLGCIGVAGAVHIYIKDKLPTVAILRCLGASGRKAFCVYLVQVAGIGLLGALAGAALGALIQKFLPWVVRDLPAHRQREHRPVVACHGAGRGAGAFGGHPVRAAAAFRHP